MRFLRFCKMHGAGNDFLIINNLEEGLPHERFPMLAQMLCTRRISVGADGLMVVEKSTNGADFRMLFYNADGSAGEMCGNGARCICRYGFEKGLSGEKQVIETPSGIVTGWRIDQKNYRVRLTNPSVVELSRSVEACGTTWDCSYIELGTPGLPHVVVPMEQLAQKHFDDLRELGRTLRRHRTFPKGANVNFYDIQAENELVLRTYERGVEDFTYACGTGTGATVLALTLLGKVSGREVAVKNPGGTLYITVDRTEEQIDNLWLTGPTRIVCTGEVLEENWNL